MLTESKVSISPGENIFVFKFIWNSILVL
jgi:hypothetical protein